MSGSVGVGGLIIGMSMLVVFSMAYKAISLQIVSGSDTYTHLRAHETKEKVVSPRGEVKKK